MGTSEVAHRGGDEGRWQETCRRRKTAALARVRHGRRRSGGRPATGSGGGGADRPRAQGASICSGCASMPANRGRPAVARSAQATVGRAREAARGSRGEARGSSRDLK
jgi:hypothetical protein